jgi:ATP-dependent DNA ligase
MLARTVPALPVGSGWAYEPKLDGFRALAFHTAFHTAGGVGVVLQSRQQRKLTDYFPDITAAIARLDDSVVLDGELVIWRQGRLDFAALQDRLRSGPARARTQAIEAPAAYVVFDLLARDGKVLLDRPYTTRRRKLEKFAARGLPHGLVLTPATTDPAVARSWLLGHTTSGSGIEGVVAKHVDQPYRPGVRGWQKLRTHLTAEAVVGGIIGPLHAPSVLLLGRPDPTGRLQLAGRTTALSPTASAAVAAAIRPQLGLRHPWPEVLPSTRWGRPGPPTTYTQIQPSVVVELTVDTAVEQHRWRHPARFLRVRPDLHVDDLQPDSASAPPAAAGRPRRHLSG